MSKNKVLPFVASPSDGDIDSYESYDDFTTDLERLADYDNRLPHRVTTDDSRYYDNGWDS